MTTRISGALRIITGLVLLGAVILAGYIGRAPWVILPFTLAFTFSFIIGRLPRWQLATQTNSFGYLIKALLSTALSQLFLVSLLYLVGTGLGVLFGTHERLGTLLPADWIFAGALGAGAGLSGLIINRMETTSALGASFMAGMQAGKADPNVLPVSESRVTPETFFSESKEPDQITDEEIEAKEADLGFTLPETLRALYRQQNGGHLRSLCILKNKDAAQHTYDDLITPFMGYNRLHPCSELQIIADTFLSFADPNDDDIFAYLFRDGTDKMVLLAQWYRESLFLDYNQPGEPRVGIADFDLEDWAEHILWWPSFDAFFAELRYYDEDY